jgi:hypothetical protein
MSRDAILKDAKGVRHSYDNIKTQGFLEGHAPGARAVISFIKEKATKAFVEDNDKEAMLLRSLAKEIENRLVQPMLNRATVNKVDHPETLED